MGEVTRAKVDREAEPRLPVAVWKAHTVNRMQKYSAEPERYEVAKTYNPRGFFGSKKHYLKVQPDGSIKLLTEFAARQAYGEDTALFGYVECDAAWRPL